MIVCICCGVRLEPAGTGRVGALSTGGASFTPSAGAPTPLAGVPTPLAGCAAHSVEPPATNIDAITRCRIAEECLPIVGSLTVECRGHQSHPRCLTYPGFTV